MPAEKFSIVVGYECPHGQCGVFDRRFQVVAHVADKHDRDIEPEDASTVTRTVDDPHRLLEAVYNISSHAKKYSRLGTENYRKGKKATAKQNSIKKDALYQLKHDVICGLVKGGEHTEVEMHEINNSPHICHYFEVVASEESETWTWSFHTPLDAWDGPQPTAADAEQLSEFESTEEKDRSELSLKAALTHIESVTGFSANDRLPQEYVSYGRNSYFTGWKYLSS